MDSIQQNLRSTVASISRDRMWAYAQTFQNQEEPEDLKLLVKFGEFKQATEILKDVEEKRKTLKQIKQQLTEQEELDERHRRMTADIEKHFKQIRSLNQAGE